MSDPYSAAHDLLRRLPPSSITKNLATISALCPEIADDLAVSVDTPLEVKVDAKDGREYLCCDYNRDGESYRSPWSNAYDPPLDDGALPSQPLRDLEITLNDAFDTYREMYYEGGRSSVYLWDLEEGGFAGVVLLKKDLPSPTSPGSWNSIHVFETRPKGSRTASYSLTSTVLLWLKGGVYVDVGEATGGGSEGEVELGGSMTRQTAQDLPTTSTSAHVVNIGRLIEDMETKQRNSLSDVYFGKTRDIVSELRSVEGSEHKKREADLRRELMGAFGRRGVAA